MQTSKPKKNKFAFILCQGVEGLGWRGTEATEMIEMTLRLTGNHRVNTLDSRRSNKVWRSVVKIESVCHQQKVEKNDQLTTKASISRVEL